MSNAATRPAPESTRPSPGYLVSVGPASRMADYFGQYGRGWAGVAVEDGYTGTWTVVRSDGGDHLLERGDVRHCFAACDGHVWINESRLSVVSR